MTTTNDAQLIKMLTDRGIRPSALRLAVLSQFVNVRNHPSADTVYSFVSALYPSTSRTSVYNALHLFADCGLIRALDIDSAGQRYDLSLQPQHSHFICRRCSRIFDMELPLQLQSIDSKGFKTESIDLVYRGLCPQCAQQQIIK